MALAAGLTEMGIDARVVPFNIHTANTAIMHILIGPKR